MSDDNKKGSLVDLHNERAKRLADKYILADGSDPPTPTDEMSNEELRTLEDEVCGRMEKYYVEQARRRYKKDFPKEMALRLFGTRVKCEFMDKLVQTQRDAIEQVCDAPPPPTWAQRLEHVTNELREKFENHRAVFELMRCRQGQDDFDFWYALYPPRSSKIGLPPNSGVRIWRRIRDDWGTIEPNTFEADLEQEYQHDLIKREAKEAEKRAANSSRERWDRREIIKEAIAEKGKTFRRF
jgi:hypothetical protein